MWHVLPFQEAMSPQYQNVGSTASVATVLTRLDELSRRVAALESGLTADVRRILQLLQARDQPLAPHNAAHTPSQPLPKASLSVPQSDVRVQVHLYNIYLPLALQLELANCINHIVSCPSEYSAMGVELERRERA